MEVGRNVNIIGLVGRRRAGKDTAALALTEQGYHIAKFAGALKGMIRTLLAYQGADADTIERLIEGDLKETPTHYLGGRSTRHAMQTLGTEWGRDLIARNLWVRCCIEHIKQYDKVVISDVRFSNEVEAVKAVGGTIVRISRANGTADSHISEAEIDSLPADFEIANDGTIEDLQKRIVTLTKNH